MPVLPEESYEVFKDWLQTRCSSLGDDHTLYCDFFIAFFDGFDTIPTQDVFQAECDELMISDPDIAFDIISKLEELSSSSSKDVLPQNPASPAPPVPVKSPAPVKAVVIDVAPPLSNITKALNNANKSHTKEQPLKTVVTKQTAGANQQNQQSKPGPKQPNNTQKIITTAGSRSQQQQNTRQYDRGGNVPLDTSDMRFRDRSYTPTTNLPPPPPPPPSYAPLVPTASPYQPYKPLRETRTISATVPPPPPPPPAHILHPVSQSQNHSPFNPNAPSYTPLSAIPPAGLPPPPPPPAGLPPPPPASVTMAPPPPPPSLEVLSFIPAHISSHLEKTLPPLHLVEPDPDQPLYVLYVSELPTNIDDTLLSRYLGQYGGFVTLQRTSDTVAFAKYRGKDSGDRLLKNHPNSKLSAYFKVSWAKNMTQQPPHRGHNNSTHKKSTTQSHVGTIPPPPPPPPLQHQHQVPPVPPASSSSSSSSSAPHVPDAPQLSSAAVDVIRENTRNILKNLTALYDKLSTEQSLLTQRLTDTNLDDDTKRQIQKDLLTKSRLLSNCTKQLIDLKKQSQ